MGAVDGSGGVCLCDKQMACGDSVRIFFFLARCGDEKQFCHDDKGADNVHNSQGKAW